jgi:hypothetical protein
MKTLLITGLGSYLREYRGDRSYRIVEELFDIPKSSYSRYEKEKTAIPFNLFQEIVKHQQGNANLVYPILNENSDNVRYFSGKAQPIKLPLKPSKQFREILSLLEAKQTYINFLTTENSLFHQIEQIFGLTLKPKQVILKHKFLTQFLRTYCIYDEITSSLPKDKFMLLQQKWKEGLLEL